MAALASLMVWPASVTVRTFTNGGRTYKYAKVLHVLAADVAAAVSAGLVTICASGAVPQAGDQTLGVGVPVTGVLGSSPLVAAGGWAGLTNNAGGGPDPNRPTPAAAGSGALHFDAALQKFVVSDGVSWLDAATGNLA